MLWLPAKTLAAMLGGNYPGVKVVVPISFSEPIDFARLLVDDEGTAVVEDHSVP